MIDTTNADLLEALSTRYVAPRILMLTSGKIALIPMMGKGEIQYFTQSTFDTLVAAIPSCDELERIHAEIQRTHRAKPTVFAKPTATLDDLI